MHNGKQILKELGSSSGKESKDTDRKRFNEYPSFIEDQVKIQMRKKDLVIESDLDSLSVI